MSEISKYALGPAVTVNITLDMLELLARATSHPQPELTSEEHEELQTFRMMVASTLLDPGLPGTVHGFCL